MSTLKEKTAKGLSWGLADNIVGAGMTAVVSILLARILTPEDFGLVGMVAIFIALGTIIYAILDFTAPAIENTLM